MKFAPIVVFTYNRPDHLRQTLEALQANHLAAESILYIFCDGPKSNASDEDRKRINSCIELAYAQKWAKELHVVVQESNKGLADSIIGGVTEVVTKYGRVIVLEDDIVTSVGFLQFMNEALEMYCEEDRVMHVSSYMYPHRESLPETFFYPVPYPGGGWATWSRAWKHFNNNTEQLYNYWDGRWQEFDCFGGDYLSKQLRANLDGTLKTWFIKWHAVMLQRGALTLYPGRSLTNNIGFDVMATNCGVTNKFDVAPIARVKVERRTIKVNKRATRIIYAFYQGRWYNRRRRNAFFKRILSYLNICR